MTGVEPGSWYRGPLGFLRRHPVLFLVLLSPGIPEYLSGSSQIQAIVLNPFLFVFQILANLALYGPGVLLVREAAVRWKKGWATILLLGGAYGILEEGIALSTIFNPAAGPVGSLGYFGHWAGVSWVWAAGVVPFHAIFSISIPILLLGLAVPSVRTQSLLKGKRLAATMVILAVDVAFLVAVVYYWTHFWMGLPLFVGSFAVMGALVYLARRAPSDWPVSRLGPPRFGLRRAGIVGAAFFPGSLVVQGLTQSTGIPVLTLVSSVAFQVLYLSWVAKRLSFPGNARYLLAFAAGLLAPLFVAGVIVNVPVELVLLVDLGLYLLFVNLFNDYPAGGVSLSPQMYTGSSTLRTSPST